MTSPASTSTATPPTGAPQSPRTRLPLGLLLLCLAVHVPLGLAMQANRAIATAHAAATVATTIWVLAAARSPGPLLRVAAYVVGAEVLWRQTEAVAPWELSKYLLILISTVGVIRFVGRPQRSGTTIVFLAALLPACAVPFVRLGPVAAIEPVSFNVAGLVALGLGVLFVSQVAGPWWSMRPALWCLVAPVIATATLGTEAARGLSSSDFVNESSFKATGGFGPNQVPVVLGLGALCLILLAICESGFVRPFVSVTMAMWFLVQGGLTFSRGGMTNVAVALLVALPVLLRRRSEAARVFGLLLVIGLVGTVVVFPRVDQFTGGALTIRFSDTREADVRTELVRKEFETFIDHVALGVGAGQSEAVEVNRRTYASHTEYTRLLAEHGILGVVAIVCLVAMAVSAYRRQQISWGHAWTLAFSAWALVDMLHAATRVAAPSFAFALAMFTFVPDRDDGRAGPR